LIYIKAGCSLFEAISRSMEIATGHAGAKLREKHHSFDESVDEPARLIEDEVVDIEQENPSRRKRAIAKN